MSARVTALCCFCGSLRTVSKNYSAGHSRVWPGEAIETKEALREMQARGLVREQRPGWRCLTILKCDHYGERTRHAFIRDDKHRNYAEEEDHATSR